ncbi:hypothetical protein CEXT_298331 [Caerostris extrusa]|uniref:Uncharacterized protein n=1 Tax=Caerostris extrusa TaxID=172846 RepID=A0AAV4M764_CAEEX|nr:hypothetical protein CEXT_298331 [Caerostris extrusa]
MISIEAIDNAPEIPGKHSPGTAASQGCRDCEIFASSRQFKFRTFIFAQSELFGGGSCLPPESCLASRRTFLLGACLWLSIQITTFFKF